MTGFTFQTRLREEHSDVAIHTIVKLKADIMCLLQEWIATSSADGLFTSAEDEIYSQ